MSKKNTIFLVVGLVIIIALLAVIILTRKPSAPNMTGENQSTETQANADGQAAANVAGDQSDQFRAPVPADIVVPGMNQKLADSQKDIAVPTVVTTAAPGASTQFRSFNISGDGGKFFPSKIIGRVGDTIHINFTAADKDYDIVFPSYNMKQTAKKGETKVLEFQALQEGDFTYYCQLCGGPTSAAQGHIIIAK